MTKAETGETGNVVRPVAAAEDANPLWRRDEAEHTTALWIDLRSRRSALDLN
jgi:hypothetical protein